MKRKLLCAALSLALCLGLAAPAWAAGPTFPDVPADHWAYASIEKMAEEGVMNGTGSGRFNPSGTVTNGEFVVMLVRAFYPSSLARAEREFGSGEWWLPATEVASDAQLLRRTQYGSVHDLTKDWLSDSSISRLHMAVAIDSLLKNAGISATDEQRAAAEAEINDWEEIDSWERETVAGIYALGLIQGDNQGNFRPEASMTRAEAAVVMDRLLSYGIQVQNDNLQYNGSSTQPVDPEPTPEPAPSEEPAPSGDTVGAITPASQVNSVRPNVGKSDAYPTKGGGYYFASSENYISAGQDGRVDYDGILAKAQTLSNNGYRTGANVDIGNASLVYELLDMVNEMRAEGGVAPLAWCPSDSSEEYSLVRARELVTSFSHDRPVTNDPLTTVSEVIARGYGNAESAFNGWKNSPGHYEALMSDTTLYMRATRHGNYWAITLWNEYSLANVERYSVTNYVE